ncbi:MAG: MG2 domain-containing protein, partial [Anaerolineales bacterium]
MAHNFRHLRGRYKILVLIFFLLLVSAGAYIAIQGWPRSESDGQPIPVAVDSSVSEGGQTVMQDEAQPVSIRLSEGQSQPQPVEQVPLATGEPLPTQEIQKILARLPAFEKTPQDQVDFKLAQQPIPPPRTGETVAETFPPAPESMQPGQVDTGPLQVLRYSPEGEIPTAPFISVTFNQPMVPLATLEALSAEEAPVRIEPSLPGAWRWVGARTLTFEYDSELIDRLPKATEYRVSVPAGTRSATGGELAETVEWFFTTPAPVMTVSYPQDEPQPRNPLFFITFDQRINPSAVLETIQVKAGNQTVALELAQQEDIQADKRVSGLVKNTLEGRWLAFRAQDTLPADTAISVTVGPGTPSAEGPRVTQQAQTFSFHTYAPLRIQEHGCSWSGDRCYPLTPLFIRFNNPIDSQSYSEDMLSIAPELPGASVNIFGDTLQIRGATQGQTTYTVTLSGEIQDIFGQKLGSQARLTFRIGPAEPLLKGPDQPFVTLDPSASKVLFNVYAINYTKLDVKIHAVQPSDWPAFQLYLREYARTDTPPELPGRQVLDKTIPVEAPADTLTEVGIDLSPYMDGDSGQFVVMVKPPKGLFQKEQYWQTVHAWVQVTQIGLDAFVDHSEMVVWATALQDGAPLAGVSVQAQPGGVQVVTQPDGTARFPIPDGAGYLVASQGADQALLPSSTYWDTDTWQRRTVLDELRWYVFDDRQMYRPGEEVHVKGWLRRIGGKQDGDVGLVGGAVSAVSYRIMGPQGNELGTGSAEVNALGGFDLAFTIPQSVNLGYAQLFLNATGSLQGMDGLQHSHAFQIQEFRRPEFEVTARNETPGPYFAGEPAVVAVEAKYYAGGPLPNAEVNWLVSSTPSNYNPPNWPDFVFGIWEPWWWSYQPVIEEAGYPGYGPSNVETFSGQTDSSGEHYLQLDFEDLELR